MKKQPVTVAITRDDLLNISEFSRRFNTSRVKVYRLIAENMLNTEIICGVTYISIADKAVISNAMQYKTSHPGQWSRNHDNKIPIIKGSEQDMEFEMAWRASMGIT
jgi:hypothetical protein